jgi:hypothetical protein
VKEVLAMAATTLEWTARADVDTVELGLASWAGAAEPIVDMPRP